MAESTKEYSRLPGRGMRREGLRIFASGRTIYSLWMGRDHLLLVEREGYTETYKRFYFNDIQAIIIRRTNSATIVSAVTAVLALLFFVWGLSVFNIPGRVVLWILGGIFALFCLIEVSRGPTCVTRIQTAVQTEQLPSWGRVRAVRKGLARLRPRLQEAQGAVSPEDVKAQWIEGLRGQSQSPATEAF